ncbi:hypothetical protein CLU79DRAFT_709908 [Phycomyces nitens]|nr:hypothetical protein CLU79DRAFT_709908 [Phycomyces nitens]
MKRYPDIPSLANDLDTSTTHTSSSGSSLTSSPLSMLDSLPPVPTHKPSSIPPSPIPPSLPVDIPPRVSMPVPQPYRHPPPRQPSPTPPSLEPAIQLPSRTNYAFPFSMTVDPKELAHWITKRDNPPSVLLLDVRPRNVFQRACIKHKWIVQVEPLVLQKNVSSMKIEESLVLNSESDQHVFGHRNEFDLIVYYDQGSRGIHDESEALKNLRAAIYELEFTKKLARVPMLLSGGFDAWQKTVEEKGIFRFNTEPLAEEPHSASSTRSNKPKEDWIFSVVGKGPNYKNKTPSQVRYTTYDYVSFNNRTNATASPSRPALQGDYSHNSSPSLNSSGPMIMPLPENYGGSSTPTTPKYESVETQYPKIHPNSSVGYQGKSSGQKTGLRRQNTFIDNPFHGFTDTTTTNYGVAPETNRPPRPSRPLPPPLPRPPSLTRPHPSVITTHSQAPVSDSSFSQLGVMVGTTGLKNLGNTCFMNSIIQCLSGTIPLARYFITGTYKKHINPSNPLGTGGALANSFAELLSVMWGDHYNFISPVSFRKSLIKFAPQFSGTEQQDSQEFLNFLLDGLHEDINTVTRRPSPTLETAEEEAAFERLPDWQASGIAWEKYLARNASLIVTLFQGQYRSRLRCLSCNTTSTTYNTFMSLSLPIPAKRSGPSSVSLFQCLDYFVKEEVLEKDNSWNCPTCKKHRRATKSLTLSRLPDVLLIHLKRFSFDGPFRDKLETMVKYPLKGLDLSRYVPSTMTDPSQDRPSFNYDLYGVSNHYGSLTGGHYTACVRNKYRDQWHNFDDTRFSVCDEDKVTSRAAYNLFYVRSTVR